MPTYRVLYESALFKKQLETIRADPELQPVLPVIRGLIFGIASRPEGFDPISPKHGGTRVAKSKSVIYDDEGGDSPQIRIHFVIRDDGSVKLLHIYGGPIALPM